MGKKTKIVVFHAKELIYTGIFMGLVILLIILIVLMFHTKSSKEIPTEDAISDYVAGVYKTTISLNNVPIDVTVTVDSDHINSIEFVNLSESITTMYPLLEPSLENIASQIYEKQSTKDITYPEESRYTSTMLIDAIEESLKKASAL